MRHGNVEDATVYVANLYERRTGPTSDSHVFYVAGDAGLIAQVTYADAETVTTFIVGDSLGSATLFLDPGGTVVEKAYYAPFGARVDDKGQLVNDPELTTTVGFTGHEEDDGNLVNMRGRIYDKARYRFLTPDPIVSRPLFGQAYNPYSYVLNSPLNYRDPSGYDPEDSLRPDRAPDEVYPTPGGEGRVWEPDKEEPDKGYRSDSDRSERELREPQQQLLRTDHDSGSPASEYVTAGSGYVANEPTEVGESSLVSRTLERLEGNGEYSPFSSLQSNGNLFADPDDPRAEEKDDKGRPTWDCSGQSCRPNRYLDFGIGTDDLVEFVLFRGALTLISDAVRFYRARKAAEQMIASGTSEIGRGGLTAVGRALQKHAARPGGSYFAATTNSAQNARAGAGFLRFLFRAGIASTFEHPVYGSIVRVRLPNGAGAQFTKAGKFIGLLEPYTPR